MEENKDYQISRVDDTKKEETPLNTVTSKKEESEETNKNEEEKKLSTSRLFVLFVILDCILGIFLIAELIWLFVDFFTKG